MGGRRPLAVLRLPDGFWSRPDVYRTMADRDFGELFRLVAKYAGASQTQIAIAVGMTQGQVSTIVAGGRRVTAIDVAERTLDGLGTPDEARIALGLAPRALKGGHSPEAGNRLDRLTPDTGVNGRDRSATGDDVDRRDVLRLGGGAAFGALADSTPLGQRLGLVARALTAHAAWDSGGTPTAAAVPTVNRLAVSAAQAKRDYQACRYSAVLEMLPTLLAAVRLSCQTATGDELLRAYSLAADAYQVTGSVVLKHGDMALATLAADRSVDAAVCSQDRVTLAASARLVTHSLMSAGHNSRAQEIATRAGEQLAAEVSRPNDEALSVYGALLLRGAVAAARAEDRQGAAGLVDEAADAARRLGRDDNMHWTAFGPSNVEQHRVHVAMLLGDAGTAVDVARRIDVDRIPIAERRAVLFIDTATALAQWGKYERAYQALRAADEVAPEEIRSHKAVPQLVEDLVSRGPHGIRVRAREFAESIGAQL